MNFNFGEILTRSWQIIWKHKILLIFGILASCGRGGGNFNSNSSSVGGGGGNGDGFGQTPDLPPQVLRWIQWVEENTVTFIILLCAVVLAVWLAAKAISAIGRIGLIRGTTQVEDGAESLIFGQLFSEGMPYFWRMFSLSVLVELPLIALSAGVVIMAITLILPLSLGGNEAVVLGGFSMLALFGLCFCLLIPVMIVVYMVVHQSERAIVLEEMNLLASISRGWRVFTGNLGPVILMAIILGVISFIVGLVITIPFFLIVVPAMLAYFVGGAQSTTPLILMGVFICLFIPVVWGVQGIITAYSETAWTLTYIRLTKKPDDNAPIALEANA